jgi:hypothetical protein
LKRDVDRLVESLGHRALQVRVFKLCRSVKDYGVFEELDGTKLVAGLDHPMIVYVELEHFMSVLTADQDYQVRLAEEIELFTESDGISVWRKDRLETVDESRNPRRDFFLASVVRLPASLGVGRYRLKVRVMDMNNQSVDEAIVPIQIGVN